MLTGWPDTVLAVRIQAAGEPVGLDEDLLILGDNEAVLKELPPGAFDLVYMDPPFNTGGARVRRSLETVATEDGARIGFGGRRYSSRLLQTLSYDDCFGDYLGFLEPRL